MSVLFAILLFSFLIFVHELGHFAAAKLSGVQVNEFALFMGPAIFKKQVGETLYSIRCIPMGGYCAMEGEDGGSDNPRAFDKAAWWKRLIILAAGATMNFIAGVLIFAILYLPGNQVTAPVQMLYPYLPVLPNQQVASNEKNASDNTVPTPFYPLAH
jgi:regulator of sigma E protease